MQNIHQHILYELAKMDGAIVLSGDIKKILFANAQLIQIILYQHQKLEQDIEQQKE